MNEPLTAEQVQSDLALAVEALSYYANLGACACDERCECGHCKARRILIYLNEHPARIAYNTAAVNNKFLAAEWTRLNNDNYSLRAQRDEARARVAGLEAKVATIAELTAGYMTESDLDKVREILSADPLKAGEAIREVVRQSDNYDSRDNDIDAGLLRSHVIFAARALSAALKGEG